MFELQPVTPTIGAEIFGLDLSNPLSQAEFDALRGAWLEHQVLILRGQGHIRPQDQLALAARLGTPVVHPAYPTVAGAEQLNILTSTRDKPTKIDSWHTDMTFLERPPMGSLLRAIEIPSAGGDTLFASLHGAWRTLSPQMQRYLQGLEASHSFAHGFRHSLAEPGGAKRLAGAVEANPPVRHPIVRAHPESGRPCLFVNRLFTTHIVGLAEPESDAVLAFLYQHLETPELSLRVRWQPGTLVLWDNRATLHRPVNDYWPATRTMHRVTIEGDRPRAWFAEVAA